MGRLVSLVVALVLGLVLVTTAAAGSREEKQRLTKADMARARHALVRQSDLVSGWTSMHVPADSNGPRCRGYNPDFSRFTITGKAASGFTRGAGNAVASAIELYPSAAQASGDFAVGVRPSFLSCFSSKLAQQFKNGGLDVVVASKRTSRSPHIGVRAVSWHLVFKVGLQGRTVDYYVDLYSFQVNRALGSVSFQSLTKPIPRQTALARLVASRLG